MSTPLNTKRKIGLTAIFTLLIVGLGVAYQFYYLEERSEYEMAITRHALQSQGRKLSPRELRHLVTLALDRYGSAEFYRVEKDYEELFEDLP